MPVMKKFLFLIGLLFAFSAQAQFSRGYSAAFAHNQVTGPVTGPVSPGTWTTTTLAAPMPGGGGELTYSIQYPPNYSKTAGLLWPVLFLGHELDEGMNGSQYPRGPVLPTVNEMALGVSTVAFRTEYPAIVVMPQVDQTLDLSGANGNANGGCYGDNQMSGQNEQAQVALAKFILATEAADPTRFYYEGSSLGGIAMLAQLIDNNAYNGPANKIWAAGFSMSDQCYRPATPNSSVFARMANVPIIAVSTPGDNNPSSYDKPACTYGGATSYPGQAQYDSGGMAAIRCGTSQFYYICTDGGQPWNTFAKIKADGGDGDGIFNVVFSTVSTAVNPTNTPSPDNTIVPPATAIVDASGNQWTITAGAQVAENGNPLAGTKNVVQLAWEKGVVWQLNSAGNWYSIIPFSGPTTTSPIPVAPPPPPPPVETLSIAPIAPVETVGVPWTITGTIGGVSKAPTLEYRDGGAGAWVPLPVGASTASGFTFVHPAFPTPFASMTTTVVDASNTTVQATSNSYAVAAPAPPPPPPTTQSPNNTVVLAGSGAAIVDAAGNVWTISAGGEVLENGNAPAFSANVAEIAYVSKGIFQGNASNQWYSWDGTAWAGGPNPFTSVCAYNPASAQTTCTNAPPP